MEEPAEKRLESSDRISVMDTDPSNQCQRRVEGEAPTAKPVEACPPLAEGDPPKAGAAQAPIIVIQKRNFWLLGLLLLGSIPFLSWKITLSVLAGSLISALNFRLLSRGVRDLMNPEEGKKTSLFSRFILKYLLLIGLIGVILLKVPVHPLAFLIGLSTLIFAILFEVIYHA